MFMKNVHFLLVVRGDKNFKNEFIGSVSRQRLCFNFSISRVNFLTTLRSHLNVSCYFWSNLFNVDVNCSYILSFDCSGYLKYIEKYLVNYPCFDNC